MSGNSLFMVKTKLPEYDTILSEARKMDLVQIGKFIAQLRKAQGLTQEQLGEKLLVTNKTVSRWETGTYLPPAEALLSMSELFDVSVNEILSGRRLSAQEYKAAAEENLTQAISASSFTLKDKIYFYKKKWLKEHIAVMCFLAAGIVCAVVLGIVLKELLLEYAALLIFIAAHLWRYNAMMSYVEKKAYDGQNAHAESKKV
jgi:transcriptional regulator with XRE-family HTH domain